MNNKFLIFGLALCTLLEVSFARAVDEFIEFTPRQWFGSENAGLRSNDQTGTGYTRADGDFDGDGKQDHAALKVQASGGSSFRLVVTLSTASGQAYTVKSGSNIQAVGIETIKPGRYKTACAKGAGPRDGGCLPEVVLLHDGLSLFTFESGSMLIYWEEGRFKEVAIAD